MMMLGSSSSAVANWVPRGFWARCICAPESDGADTGRELGGPSSQYSGKLAKLLGFAMTRYVPGSCICGFSPGLHQWSKLRREEVSPDGNDIGHTQGSANLLLNVKRGYRL